MLSPRENLRLIGHENEQDFFLNAFHSERFSPAWIVSGPFGIGKATFAFHMARYILSGRQNKDTVFSENDPLHCRIKARSHGDLWTLPDDNIQEIGVDQIRDLNHFLNQTTIEGGWRVIIIDQVDKLNRNAANALLKRLEEPPSKTVFFLTTQTPTALLPTIRSRCQLLALESLSQEQVRKVIQAASLPADFPSENKSPGEVLRICEGEGREIYNQLMDVLKGGRIASFVQKCGGNEESYAIVENLLRTFLHDQLLMKIEGTSAFFKDIPIEKALDIYEQVECLLSQCRFAHQDRKATLTCILSDLQEAL